MIWTQGSVVDNMRYLLIVKHGEVHVIKKFTVPRGDGAEDVKRADLCMLGPTSAFLELSMFNDRSESPSPDGSAQPPAAAGQPGQPRETFELRGSTLVTSSCCEIGWLSKHIFKQLTRFGMRGGSVKAGTGGGEVNDAEGGERQGHGEEGDDECDCDARSSSSSSGGCCGGGGSSSSSGNDLSSGGAPTLSSLNRSTVGRKSSVSSNARLDVAIDKIMSNLKEWMLDYPTSEELRTLYREKNLWSKFKASVVSRTVQGNAKARVKNMKSKETLTETATRKVRTMKETSSLASNPLRSDMQFPFRKPVDLLPMTHGSSIYNPQFGLAPREGIYRYVDANFNG